MKKKTLKVFSTIIILLLVLAVLYRMFIGSMDDIIANIKELSGTALVLILFCAVMYQITEGYIATLLLRTYNAKFKLSEGIQTVFQGCFYRGITLGSGTQAGQMYFLTSKGIEPSQSMCALTISYVMQKVGVFLYITICFIFGFSFFHHNYRNYTSYIFLAYFVSAIIILFLLLFICSKRFHKLLTFLLNKILRKEKHKNILEKINRQIKDLSFNAKSIFHNKTTLIQVLIMELVKLSWWYIIPYITLKDLGVLKEYNLELFSILSVSALMSSLVGIIPAPSGIMSTELIFTALFSVLVGKGNAGSAMVIYRCSNYIIPILLGILAWIFLRRSAYGRSKSRE